MEEKKEVREININHIISVAILVAAGLIAVNIHRAQNKKIAEIYRIQKDEGKKYGVLIRVEDLKRRVESYKKRFQPRDSREIIKTITDVAADTQVRIISLKSTEGTRWKEIRNDIYDKIFFELHIRVDDYNQLGRFISKLESAPSVFTVEKLNMATRDIEQAVKSETIDIGLTISEAFFKKR